MDNSKLIEKVKKWHAKNYRNESGKEVGSVVTVEGDNGVNISVSEKIERPEDTLAFTQLYWVIRSEGYEMGYFGRKVDDIADFVNVFSGENRQIYAQKNG